MQAVRRYWGIYRMLVEEEYLITYRRILDILLDYICKRYCKRD